MLYFSLNSHYNKLIVLFRAKMDDYIELFMINKSLNISMLFSIITAYVLLVKTYN